MIDVAIGIAIIAVCAVLGAFKPDLASIDHLHRLWKAVRLTGVAAGLALVLGVFSLEPDSSIGSLEWRTDLEKALTDARQNGKPVVLDTGAEWCAACKELEHKTFSDPRVIRALDGFVAVRLDMTAFDEAQERLKKIGIGISSLPWVGFFLPDGRLNPGATLTDFEGPELFLNRIEQAAEYREAGLSPLESWLGEKGLAVALILVFLAGLGVSLTPCVYPMIPITIAVVGAGGGEQDGTEIPMGRRALRSAAFVGGLAVNYAVLGVLSAALGKGFGSWLQHPAVTLTMAVLFVALAASFVGFFSIDIPASLKARMGRARGGTVGAAVAGAATGFVAAPCAGPVVVGILAVVSGTGDLVLGFFLMLTFALGMGVLFFGIGMSTTFLSRLPRSGPWMERVEIVFAVVFLLVALYYGRLALAS